jgi:uncharacterized protein DUF3455
MMNERSETKMITEAPSLRRLGTIGLAGLSSNKRTIGALALLLGIGLAALAEGSHTDNRAPEVPFEIKVDDGNIVHFHGYAIGVQIYTWNGTDWGTAVPRATLFDNDGNVVISHFGTTNGPAWVSNSGSEVVGKLPPKKVIVDETAIPWLLLAAIPDLTHGPGILAATTFVHRVNTVGGLAPRENGTVVGQVAEVPYNADYFFYRSTDK